MSTATLNQGPFACTKTHECMSLREYKTSGLRRIAIACVDGVWLLTFYGIRIGNWINHCPWCGERLEDA